MVNKVYELRDKKTGFLEDRFFLKNRANLVKKQLERNSKRRFKIVVKK